MKQQSSNKHDRKARDEQSDNRPMKTVKQSSTLIDHEKGTSVIIWWTFGTQQLQQYVKRCIVQYQIYMSR
jgi:hypothetical protein